MATTISQVLLKSMHITSNRLVQISFQQHTLSQQTLISTLPTDNSCHHSSSKMAQRQLFIDSSYVNSYQTADTLIFTEKAMETARVTDNSKDEFSNEMEILKDGLESDVEIVINDIEMMTDETKYSIEMEILKDGLESDLEIVINDIEILKDDPVTEIDVSDIFFYNPNNYTIYKDTAEFFC